MKKSLIALSVAGLFLVSACGPSAEEKAAEAKRVQDSIDAANAAAAAAAKATQDSIALVQEQMAAAEKAKQDSIAALEEAAKNKKGGKPAPKKVVEAPKKEEPKKAPGSLKDKIGAESQNQSGTQADPNKPQKLKDKLK
ncbi:MAG: hypothetical protein JSS90_00100 [Bacteroidetes bacterium]|nr:hypothetical protein [Bacteroidota bacterium]